MNAVLTATPDLGRVYVPKDLLRVLSLPGIPARRKMESGEVGIFIASQRRKMIMYRGGATPVQELIDKGILKSAEEIGHEKTWWEVIWSSITHNERVDAGAAFQKDKTFASATGVATSVASASASLTKAKGDQSLGTATAGATTNEHTASGLSRATGTVGTYTAPSTLGGTFQQDITRSFSVTGTTTSFGAGLFNSNTAAGSIMYVEDNFGSSASLVNGDTLNVTVSIIN